MPAFSFLKLFMRKSILLKIICGSIKNFERYNPGIFIFFFSEDVLYLNKSVFVLKQSIIINKNKYWSLRFLCRNISALCDTQVFLSHRILKQDFRMPGNKI